MKSTRYRFEIIVVVDGFVDKTFEIASKIQKKEVRVMGYRENKGKGYAVRYGMSRARGDFIAFIDAGTEINANGISMILEHMLWYDADIIVGSKRHPASKVVYPFTRKLYSFAYQLLVYLLFRFNVRDTQVGLKVFRRKVLEDVLPRLVVKRFAFDVELLSVARHLGYKRMFEAPVEITYKPGSAFSNWILIDPFVRGMLIDTIAIFYRMNILRYYDSSNEKGWRAP